MILGMVRVLAKVALFFGLFRLMLGIAIGAGVIGPYEAALSRYTAAASSGEVINEALVVILLAFVVGQLFSKARKS